MTADTVDLLTSLYALRSQAGVVRTHAERQRNLTVAVRMATFQGEVSEEIERLQKLEESTSEHPAHVD